MSDAEVLVARPARTDLEQILNYLDAHAGEEVAATYGDRFRQALSRLRSFPEHGAPRPALGPAIRSITIAPFRLFYKYDGDAQTVSVLRILHERRRLTVDLLES